MPELQAPEVRIHLAPAFSLLRDEISSSSQAGSGGVPGFVLLLFPQGDPLRRVSPILLKGTKAATGIQFPNPPVCGHLGSPWRPLVKEEVREADGLGAGL